MDKLVSAHESAAGASVLEAATLQRAQATSAPAQVELSNICAYCLRGLENISLCGKCKKRKLCSRECQLADWRSGHKKFCGQSGELDVDFEIRATDDRGFAIFALREFARGEKVLSERSMMSVLKNGDIVRADNCNMEAIFSLVPEDSSDVMKKFSLNAMSCRTAEFPEDVETGLFMLTARGNHACLSNTQPCYMKDIGILVLVASRQIMPGEEITYQYINDFSPEIYDQLQSKWGFQCRCKACENSEIGEALRRINDLDNKLLAYGRSGKYDMALRCGKSLIALYDKLQESPRFYERTYFDMFQMAVTRQSTMKDAVKYIRLALESHVLFIGADGPNALEYQMYNENPASHKNYLIG